MGFVLMPLVLILVVLLALDVCALRWGHDSRHASDPGRDWS
jgi:hypothetical protein